MGWELHCGDCLKILPGWPADSVDLVFFSPPYEDARTYGIDFKLSGQQWVDWMVKVFVECRRLCKGSVFCVCSGRTRKYKWSAVPSLLEADLHRAGFCLRDPCIFHRVGIPGSGGPDGLRHDYERIIWTTQGGKLPWSDNTTMGHPPKWAPGGEMSYRLSDGTRRNQWGGGEKSTGNERQKNGERRPAGRPSHRVTSGVRHKNGVPKRFHQPGSEGKEDQAYNPPALANPGNVIKLTVGGGLMGGDEYCSQNEAPFPESLAEFFIRSFCPEGGRVLDPMCGSGTTVAVAHRWKRHGIGIDVRQAMVDLSTRRLENEPQQMFV